MRSHAAAAPEARFSPDFGLLFTALIARCGLWPCAASTLTGTLHVAPLLTGSDR